MLVFIDKFLFFFSFSEDIFRFLKKLLKNNQEGNFPIKGENWEDEGNSFFNLKDCVKTPSLWGFKTQILKHANSFTKRKLKLLLSIVNQT